MDINERLRQIRINAGLSEVQLGERIGKSRTAIYKVEKGSNHPTVETLLLGVAACDCTLEIFENENELLWLKARELDDAGEQIFCVTVEDLGRDNDIFRTRFHIHTQDGVCGHRSPRECCEVIESIYGGRFGILSKNPGYIAYYRTNIPRINEIRAKPKRVRFPLHGSYVDVPGIVL